MSDPAGCVGRNSLESTRGSEAEEVPDSNGLSTEAVLAILSALFVGGGLLFLAFELLGPVVLLVELLALAGMWLLMSPDIGN